jgi:class 3 adenylate cyclase
MKRSVTFTCVVGVVVAAVVIVAHARGWLAPAEWPLKMWAQRNHEMPREMSNAWQISLVALLSLGVAWLTFTASARHRVAWLVLGVAAEFLALLWICSLYGILFQPMPSILAAVLSYAGAIGLLAWNARPPRPARQRAPRRAPAPEAKPEAAKPAAPDLAFEGGPRVFETTVLVCDLGDKYDLADSSEPGTAANTLVKFSERAADVLAGAGAYIYRADGEGVVALFGFPQPLSEHAEKAVRVGIDLARAFAEKPSGSNGESASAGEVHVGVSSGPIIAARAGLKRDILILGEAVELARRFCIANRFYGSRILIGPRTFEMADRTVVARPIDFLSGVTAQERHEIYEPLALAADAPAELLARRDSFWNGVVLYREKRWAEAYAAFQQARGASDEEDAPLNLYLRRLEPLALHFMEMSRE